MYVLGVEHVPNAFRQDIARAMREQGVLGVITADADTEQVDIEGAWSATVEDASVTDLLDLMAPRCDFALVEGAAIDGWPSLRVSDGVVQSELLEEQMPIDDLVVADLIGEIATTEPYVTLESLVSAVKDHPDEDRSGAIATFTGRVRKKEDTDDTPTEYLEFEQYGDIAHTKLEGIREELLARKDVFEVRMHHRSGVMHAGQDIVFVVVLAGHREEAFRTVKDGINRLKAEVPIFKKEVTVDEEYWVHNRP